MCFSSILLSRSFILIFHTAVGRVNIYTMPGTVTPATDFNVEKDCQEMRNAMKGLGTNEAKIINILGNRSRDQRLEIVVMFKVRLFVGTIFLAPQWVLYNYHSFIEDLSILGASNYYCTYVMSQHA